MPEAPKRKKLNTHLKCAKCGAEGKAVWEENNDVHDAGPMGHLVSISDNFFQRTPRNHQGQPEIACAACGAVHPD